MKAQKDAKTGKWLIQYRYKDNLGQSHKSTKRGFTTKREAEEWYHTFVARKQGKLDLAFKDFIEPYFEYITPRIRFNTLKTKKYIVDLKILPYFGEKKIVDIEPKDIATWQNAMLNYRNKDGEPYSPVYLKTLHNQLSAIFNHAVKFYGLTSNPAAKVGNMGKKKNQNREMLFWTKEEYTKFSEEMMDKPIAYYAFEVLYWTGIREGELLALTPADFDFEKGTLTINKSYQRINGSDVVTDPKTPKSNRVIQMPQFLVEEMQDYLKTLYGLQENDRIFPINKSYLYREMERGCKLSGVKRIRIHDLRHSHVSLLIQMGYSAVAIADRVGHESIDITYRYAHMFPTTQQDMADKLNSMRTEES